VKIREVILVAVLALGALSPVSVAHAASISGGLISQDTTLTAAGGPYLLSEPIQVPAGVTLTIEPGTIVQAVGANALFWVNGTFNAVGTAANPIRLIGSHNTGTIFYTRDAGSACHIHLGNAYVDGMNRANLVTATGYSQSCSYLIEDSEFLRLPDWSYFWYPNALQIRRNVFVGFGGMSIGFTATPSNQPIIENNLFVGGTPTGRAMIEAWAAYDGKLVVRGNEFRGGPYLAIQASATYGTNLLDAKSNSWGTTDAVAISAMIKDSTKSLGFGGPIDSSNPLVAASVGVPAASKYALEPQPLEIFSTTSVPAVSGNLLGGELLVAEPGKWDNGVSFTYQWMRDGQAMSGENAKTFRAKTVDIGHSLSVSITGYAKGFASVTKVSSPVGPVQGKVFTAPTDAVLAGDLNVGSELQAVAGTWPVQTEFAYTWLRNGSPIVGANSETYLLTAQDLGQKVAVSIVASNEGYLSLTRVLEGKTAVALGVLQPFTFPKITGKANVGSVLKAGAGNWSAQATFSFSWLLDGKAIKAATAQSLKVLPAFKGHKIIVKVLARLTGYSDATKFSDAVVVK
jgi:hypothetical protein